MTDPLTTMQHALDALHMRNKKVELDKAREQSMTRKICVALLTYCCVLIFFMIIDTPNPWVNACIPTLGFLLSTISLGVVKQFWIKNIKE